MTDFNFLTTHVGSVPHPVSGDLPQRLLAMLDAPAWPQLPRRSFRESMYAMYTPALPGLVIDETKEKVYFNTKDDLTPALETFYEHMLADDIDHFALRPEHAAGFFDMLSSYPSVPGPWAKGQVTGPISFGLTVTDQNLRSSLYDEQLADPIVKNMAFNARWQVRQLKTVRPDVIVFVDEPYMASFGSAFISLSREQAVAFMDEVFDAIRAEGALSGVHCCANTDWGLLLSTRVDILNLDAYGYIENLALYPAELRAFLDRGGAVCWGAVPNNEEIRNITPQGIADKLRAGLKLIAEKAGARGVSITPEELAARSLISPACGLGSTDVDTAERVFTALSETGRILQKG